ncbi:unnamed protein product [Prunus armeniaca]|uniref:Uncharacterized protein n=1 Tax=Prunus armeniaca TaxID=36596 RepID=A0A6J5WCG0_PRUAR|nr:unnamed protein product [Prunus armeniaca]
MAHLKKVGRALLKYLGQPLLLQKASRAAFVVETQKWLGESAGARSGGFLQPHLGDFMEAEGQGWAGARCCRGSFEIRPGIVQSATGWAVLKSG